MHLIGVGGVGMSGLARLLLTRGIPVSGSELRSGRPWPACGRSAAPSTCDTSRPTSTVSTRSSTPPRSRPTTWSWSRRAGRGLRVLHRSEALAAAMTGRRTIAVAGTHGKTTTTSMMTLILQHAGLDPSFVIGGEISEVGSNAHHGTGEHFVAEADESDRSFLLYRPHVAIVTNIDADHLNTYGDLAGLEDAFAEFCRLVDAGRLRGDLRRRPGHPAAGRAGCGPRAGRVYTYGEAPDADLRLTELRSSAQRRALPGRAWTASRWARSRLPVPGRHLGLNSAAAVLTALRLGLPLGQVAEALAAFPGVRRRFELKGVADGVRVYDEYAYHPTSMTAALQTLREVAGDGPADGGVPAVPGLPHPRPAGRDRRRRWPSPTRRSCMEVFGPGRGARAGRGRRRADRGDRPAAPTARSSCRPGRTCRPRWSRRARAGRRRGHHGRAADLADGRRAAGRAGRPGRRARRRRA